MKTKVCIRCGIEGECSYEPTSKFWKFSRSKDGFKNKCKDCCSKTGKKTQVTIYTDKAPECECGGKVVTQAAELTSGPSREAQVWICCSCGKQLGKYKYTGLSPEELIEIHERNDTRADYWAEIGSRPRQ